MDKGKPHHGYLVHHLNLSCGKHIVPGAKAVSACLSVCSRISSCFGPALSSLCFFMLPAGLQEAPPSRSAPLTPHGALLLSRVLPPHPAPFGIQESQYVGGLGGRNRLLHSRVFTSFLRWSANAQHSLPLGTDPTFPPMSQHLVVSRKGVHSLRSFHPHCHRLPDCGGLREQT